MWLPDSRANNVVLLRRQGELPDATLVIQAAAGERWAKEALFRRHVNRVMALAHRLMPEEDPEDLTHETFLKAFAVLKDLDNGAAFGAWLSQILVSIVKMKLRKLRWLRRIGFARQEEPDPESLVSRDAPEGARLQLRDLYRAVRQLPEEPRIALLLQRVEGLELVEIAERMGVSIATVKRRVAEADDVLKQLTGQEVSP
jgi:RNA polymerase sigma-70 factor (ECF subfamily)